jgi:hypothetical protein
MISGGFGTVLWHGVNADSAERLNALFAEVFEDRATYQADRFDEGYLEQLLANDGVMILVAHIDRDLVGGLVAYEFPKLESDRRERRNSSYHGTTADCSRQRRLGYLRSSRLRR